MATAFTTSMKGPLAVQRLNELQALAELAVTTADEALATAGTSGNVDGGTPSSVYAPQLTTDGGAP